MRNIILSLIASIFMIGCVASSNKDINLANQKATKSTFAYKNIGTKALKIDLHVKNSSLNQKKPLLIWVHGGAWKRGSKEAFITKNKLLLQSLLNEGYAVASLDYRLSGEAVFPAQIQDINDGINFLYENAKKYNLDRDKIAIMGRSAGGHLASLIGTSNSHKDTKFYAKNHEPKYKILAVVDFFGPSDLVELRKNKSSYGSPKTPEAKLLGVAPKSRPDIAKWASPTTYVDKNTPPFIILQGDNDTNVPFAQSVELDKKLKSLHVKSELYIAKNARHGDPVFDTKKYVPKVVAFLNQILK